MTGSLCIYQELGDDKMMGQEGSGIADDQSVSSLEPTSLFLESRSPYLRSNLRYHRSNHMFAGRSRYDG